MRTALRPLAIGMLAAALAATPAAAQDVDGKRMAVALGVGQANPLPLSLPYTAPSWSASVQIAVAKHLIIEGTAGGWRHTSASPSTVEGRDRFGATFVRQATTRTREGTTAFGIDALAAARRGRMRFTSGAGVALGGFSSHATETVAACTSTDPGICKGFDERYRLRLFSIQCVLGVDVALTSRFDAFVVYRLLQPFNYGLGEVNLITGVKLGLR